MCLEEIIYNEISKNVGRWEELINLPKVFHINSDGHVFEKIKTEENVKGAMHVFIFVNVKEDCPKKDLELIKNDVLKLYYEKVIKNPEITVEEMPKKTIVLEIVVLRDLYTTEYNPFL